MITKNSRATFGAALLVAGMASFAPLTAQAQGSDADRIAELEARILVLEARPVLNKDTIRDILVANPSILMEAAEAYKANQIVAQQKASIQQVAQMHQLIFEEPAYTVAGNPNGSKVLVEFFDYQCGYCRAAVPLLKEMAAADPELRIIIREYPILGEASVYAARAALAAGLQGKYVEMHEALVEVSKPLDEVAIRKAGEIAGVDIEKMFADMESKEVADKLGFETRLGQALNIKGTPSFAYPKAGVLQGLGDIERLKSFMLLAEKGLE